MCQRRARVTVSPLACPSAPPQAHQANQNKGSIYLVFEYLDHDLTGLAGALAPRMPPHPGAERSTLRQSDRA